jgi:hypothetical protein
MPLEISSDEAVETDYRIEGIDQTAKRAGTDGRAVAHQNHAAQTVRRAVSWQHLGNRKWGGARAHRRRTER